MFCRERDEDREQWDGPRAGPEGAVEDYGADDAFPISDIDEILPRLVEQCERLFYTVGTYPSFDSRVLGWVGALRSKRQAGHVPDQLVSLEHVLHEMRLFKSRREVSAMRKAGRIAVKAHKKAMTRAVPGCYEYQLEAELVHVFKQNNTVPSYLPIVASGANACILHYVSNQRRIEDGDLILIDAGCEYDMYASDVTRTFPCSGRFSAPQREIHDLVAEAQSEAIKKVVAGNHWNDPHDAAVRAITKGLKNLGVISGRLPSLVKSEAYRPYFMHRTGHWLGMDVHDVGDYRVDDHWRLLEPGMVMTVEPGVYVPLKSDKLAKRWRGIGVRIEDDVLVTRDGPDILSAGLPTTSDEVERFMAGAA